MRLRSQCDCEGQVSKPSVIAAESNTGTKFEIDLVESKALSFFFFLLFFSGCAAPFSFVTVPAFPQQIIKPSFHVCGKAEIG